MRKIARITPAMWLLPASLLSIQIYFSLLTARGLDLTDESYYMSSILFADHYRYGVSGFGSLYEIALNLSQGSWAVLRIGTSWVNWVLGAIFFWSLIGLLRKWELLKVQIIFRVSGALIGGNLSSLMMHLWLPTPNYNTLAWQGSVLFAIGLVLLYGSRPYAFVLLGLGVALAFIGKPSSAGALVALLILNSLTLGMKKAIWCLALAGATFSITIVAWAFYIDQGLVGYIERLWGGYRLTSTLALGDPPLETNILWSVGTSFWPFSGMGVFSFSAVTVAIVAFALTTKFCASISAPANQAKVIVFMAITILATALFVWAQPIGLTGVSLLVVLLGTLLAGALVLKQRFVATLVSGFRKKIERRASLLALTFALLPLILSLGSNNNYFQRGAALGSMYLASALILGLLLFRNSSGVDRIGSTRVALSQFLSTAMIAVLVLVSAAIEPYNQEQQIAEMQESTIYEGLFLDHSVEHYLIGLKLIGEEFGLSVETPIIDNTGYSPGAILALGGLPIGSAWTIGHYRGSLLVMDAQLKTYSKACLSEAWVLDEELSQTRIQSGTGDISLITSVSLYESVATFVSPLSGNEQTLYRPTKRVSQFDAPCVQGKLTAIG